jgi:hypothetical protein
MKSILLIVQLAFGLGLFLCAILPAYPHGGGLDTYGCHHNRKAGGYHCHRGPFSGQSFASQDEMLKNISAEKTAATKKNAPAKQ